MFHQGPFQTCPGAAIAKALLEVVDDGTLRRQFKGHLPPQREGISHGLANFTSESAGKTRSDHLQFICKNHGLAVTDIIRILDENYENVIHSLIKHQIVLDRRQQPRRASRNHGHLKTGRPRQSRNLLMEGLESLFGFRKLK